MSNNLTAQELRIGNFYEVDGTIYRVVSISENSFSGVVVKPVKGMHTNGGKRCPIELSDNVLSKMSQFEKTIHGKNFEYSMFAANTDCSIHVLFFKDPDAMGVNIMCSDGEGQVETGICFLHELQNLLSVLGTELNYIP